ncbi:glutamate decarboxylase, partial [Shigella dysenteriae]
SKARIIHQIQLIRGITQKRHGKKTLFEVPEV